MEKYLTDERFEALSSMVDRAGGLLAKPGTINLDTKDAARLVREVQRLRGESAMLTDAVVMGAALWFGHIKGGEADYASEVLHETAVELVKANPRLAGAFPASESEW